MNPYRLLFALLIIFTLPTVHAEDLMRQFCPNDNCGSLLVGGAYVIPNAVKWNGSSTIVISLSSNNENFGFIGKTNFLTYKQNEWRLITSSSEVDAVDLSSSSPAMGFYFAPQRAGDFTGTITYETSVLAKNERSKPVSGSAKSDNPTNPLLTLNTTIAENYTSRPCQDGTTYCTEIDVPTNRQVTFQVTPKFDSNQAGQQNISALSYARVTLDITESKVNCPPYSPSFYDSATANYSSDTYFDMMSGLDSMYPVSVQARCDRQRDFLASTNKTFNFNATAVSNTETGSYAQYLFYIAGHYDVKNPTNYLGSYQIFRLRSGNFMTPNGNNQKPTASFSITPSPAVVGVPVTLNASQSSDPERGILRYEWQSEPTLTIPSVVNPSISFQKAEDYKITLTVTDNKGEIDTTSNQVTVVPSDIVLPTAKFTVNPQSPVNVNDVLSLNATDSHTGTGQPISDSSSYTWKISENRKDVTNDGNIISIVPTGSTPSTVFKKDGTYNIQLVVKDGSTESLPVSLSVTVNAKSSSLGEACIAVKTDNGDKIPLTTLPPLMLKVNNQVKLVPCQQDAGFAYDFYTIMPDGTARNDTYSSNTPLTIPKSGDKTLYGSYSVTLSVTSQQDSTVKKVAVAEIVLSTLTVDFETTTNATQVALTGTPSDPAYSYAWLQETIVSDQPLPTGNSITIPFLGQVSEEGTGRYFITLKVTDDKQQTASVSKLVTVKKAVHPTNQYTARLDKLNEVTTFTLDAGNSCDSDNLDNHEVNACGDGYIGTSKGISSFSWQLQQPVQEGISLSNMENPVATLTFVDSVISPTVNKIEIPVIFTVKDDDIDQKGDISPLSSVTTIALSLNRPTANFTVSQNVDKTVIATSSNTLSSYAYSDVNQTTNKGIGNPFIDSCEWKFDKEDSIKSVVDKNNQCSFNHNGVAVTNGEHTISLTVTDNYGLKSLVSKKSIFVGNPLGFEGKTSEGWSWNADGTQTLQNKSGQSKFFGGVCVSSSIEMCDFSTYTKQVSLAEVSNQTAFFRAALEINDTDLGKNASLLFVFGRDKSPFNGTTTDYFVNNTPPIIDLYADPTTWMAQLTPYKMIEDQPTIKLAKNQVIFWNALISALHSNPPNPNDVLYVFFGYRIEEDGSEKGKIVYAPAPLTLTITP